MEGEGPRHCRDTLRTNGKPVLLDALSGLSNNAQYSSFAPVGKNANMPQFKIS
jgi:hypothetical protein